MLRSVIARLSLTMLAKAATGTVASHSVYHCLTQAYAKPVASTVARVGVDLGLELQQEFWQRTYFCIATIQFELRREEGSWRHGLWQELWQELGHSRGILFCKREGGTCGKGLGTRCARSVASAVARELGQGCGKKCGQRFRKGHGRLRVVTLKYGGSLLQVL